MISYILAGVTALVLLIIDQLVKIAVNSSFALGDNFTLIKGLLNFHYIHNTGGAWGVLSGYTGLLIFITAVIMIACITWLIVRGRKNKLLFWATCLIISGGLGNMIDRIFRGGKVIDFLQFGFWEEFPVFNIADCAIVIGCSLLVLYFVIDTINDFKKRKLNNGNS